MASADKIQRVQELAYDCSSFLDIIDKLGSDIDNVLFEISPMLQEIITNLKTSFAGFKQLNTKALSLMNERQQGIYKTVVKITDDPMSNFDKAIATAAYYNFSSSNEKKKEQGFALLRAGGHLQRTIMVAKWLHFVNCEQKEEATKAFNKMNNTLNLKQAPLFVSSSETNKALSKNFEIFGKIVLSLQNSELPEGNLLAFSNLPGPKEEAAVEKLIQDLSARRWALKFLVTQVNASATFVGYLKSFLDVARGEEEEEGTAKLGDVLIFQAVSCLLTKQDLFEEQSYVLETREGLESLDTQRFSFVSSDPSFDSLLSQVDK